MRPLPTSLLALLCLSIACGDDDDRDPVDAFVGPDATGPDGGPRDAGGWDGEIVLPDAGGDDLGTDLGAGVEECPTTFAMTLEAGWSNPRVAGVWHGFDLGTATAMTDGDGDGTYEATIDLPIGLHGYKLVVQSGGSDEWIFDPSEGRRTYVDGTENSAVQVRDCNVPTLEVVTSEASRPSEGGGQLSATLDYVDAIDGSGPAATFTATLRHDGVETDASGSVTVDGDEVSVALDGLADGKHTLYITPSSASGRVGEPVRVVFWVEAEAFDWNGAIVYMVMTDRYRNGDTSNDVPASGADPRAEWQGGDLEGLRQSIDEGLLDQLGIGAIWLTPFQTNPAADFDDRDGVHRVTGYHGYWPIAAREVDPRLGGADALHALVQEAHEHGIRILMDYVINHVHEEHEYVDAHPEWFRTGCVCGQDGCDWTADALECQFTPYMPDVDHRIPEANQQFVDDAVWWLDEFDLDGLRVDAVKHVETAATRNLSVAVREEFETAGTQYFLMGETAMGWNDCADPCNDENYGTIARYIGEHGLDGQFDFVLYHGVSYRTFAYGDSGMLHADYWFQHGQGKWPDDAVMTPYIGSHDTPRFVSFADYRGQDAAHGRDVPGRQWDDVAEAPSDSEAYRRMRIGMSWLLMLPGAPLLYYGDEYGQWGGADPNNRILWRPEAELNADELATLAHIRALGQARASHPALRRGRYQSLGATEDTLVFARVLPAGEGDPAIVALTRAGAGATISVDTSALGLAGTTLGDLMGGSDVTVAGDGQLTLNVPGPGVLVLAP